MRQTVVLCDLHDASVTATATVRVLVADVARRLDVCAEHAAWLGTLPEDVEDAATDPRGQVPAGSRAVRPLPTARLGTVRPSPGPNTRAGSRRSLRAERAAARDWARAQGNDVADRGRLPTGLLERYRAQAG